MTNERHLSLLHNARGELSLAQDALRGGLSEECIALELRRSLEVLGEITGESVGEDVLNAIFAKFCIGK